MSFYSNNELNELGFKSIGHNVQISRKASLYNPSNISLGNNVRIDDFCILSAGKGGIEIDNYVHVACYSSLIGEDLIKIESFCNISSRVSIYSKTDDFSGEHMTNPCVPSKLTNVISKPVHFKKHVLIGNGALVLPGVILEEGVVIGAQSFVKKSCESNFIYAGNPLRKIKPRLSNYLHLEKKVNNNVE